MIGSPKIRKAFRRAFGWMMAGYLTAVMTVGVIGAVGIGALATPVPASALSVCDIGGACFTKDACEQNEGAVWRNCGGTRVGCAPESGCGRCQPNEGYCYPKRTPVQLSIHIGGNKSTYDISQYLEYVYDFAIGIAGGLAGVMLMIGGFQYLTAGGSDRVKAAKKRISDALIGLALVLGAFLMLNTINPDLVNMSEIRVPMVKKQTFVSCNVFVMDKRCGEPFGLEEVPGNTNDPNPRLKFKVVEGATCVGQSCSKVEGKDDVRFKCQVSGTTPPAASSAEPNPKEAVPPYTCGDCKAFGDDCTTAGASDECCTGFCGEGSVGGRTCSSGEVGDSCQSPGECKSGLCQTRLGNSCSMGRIGSPCAENSECREGNICVGETGINICLPKKEGGYCDDDNDCPSGNTCTSSVAAGYPICVPTADSGFFSRYTKCGEDAHCSSGYCAMVAGVVGICSDRGPGSPCLTDLNCSSELSCVGDAITGTLGICADGEIGARCDDDGDCLLGHCFEGGGDFDACVSGSEWSSCDDDKDCNKWEGLSCDTRNKRCIRKPASGA